MRKRKYGFVILVQLVAPVLLAILALIGFAYVPWLGAFATALLGGIAFCLVFMPGFLRLQILYLYAPKMQGNQHFRLRSRLDILGKKFLIVDEFNENNSVAEDVVYAISQKTDWNDIREECTYWSIKGMDGEIILSSTT